MNRSNIAVFVVLGAFADVSGAFAGTFKIEDPKPISASKALTLRSDKTVHYEIRPGADVVVRIEGPGTLTVRAFAHSDPTSPGTDLSLMVAQDGATIGAMVVPGKLLTKDSWVERPKWFVSSPVTQRFSVTAGQHQVTLRASPGSSGGAVNIQFAREEQTVAAAPEPELVPLIPLVPLAPRKEDPKTVLQTAPPSVPGVVPLVPLASKKEEPRAIAAPPPPKEDSKWKEVVASPAGGPGHAPAVKAGVQPKEPGAGEPVKHAALAPRVGAIMPIQGIGGPFAVFGVEGRYYLPLSGQPLSVGVNAEYYAPFFTAKVTSTGAASEINASYWVVPIQIEVVYTFATGIPLRPFVGAGGGVFVVGSSLAPNEGADGSSQTGVTGGFCVLAGAVFKIGPGDIVAELRMNQATVSLDKTMQDLHVGGVVFEGGYEFTF
ncbi:MAG: hypothetical protein HY897_17790 [Deltaproteobacteria bacterium]|nr:hypothetical protein [Deltaproteobacteria bacterium]